MSNNTTTILLFVFVIFIIIFAIILNNFVILPLLSVQRDFNEKERKILNIELQVDSIDNLINETNTKINTVITKFSEPILKTIRQANDSIDIATCSICTYSLTTSTFCTPL